MSAPVETKVKAASVGAYLASVAGLAVLGAVQSDASLLGFLPDWLTALLVPVLPTAVPFVAGWQARHTPRDLPRPARRDT